MKDTTIATKQSRLAAYVDAYTSAVDGDLFARLQDPDQKPEEVRRVTGAIEHLSSGYESQAA
ncbi:site-specific integrase, partial [Salinisphaera sp. USBA-960]|nr:site-specific integrase [Salifodinibacter halophilus]